jgi:hypothetical protein
MVTRYNLEVVDSRYGDYVSYEDYESLQEELDIQVSKYSVLEETYDELLLEYNDLKFRMQYPDGEL